MVRIRGGAVLYVGDLARTRMFYESVAGLEATEGDETYVALERDGFQLVLLATATAAAHLGAGPRVGVPVKVVLVVDDLAVALAGAVAAGGTVEGGVWLFGEQRVCDVVDPEGNVVQLRAVQPA